MTAGPTIIPTCGRVFKISSNAEKKLALTKQRRNWNGSRASFGEFARSIFLIAPAVTISRCYFVEPKGRNGRPNSKSWTQKNTRGKRGSRVLAPRSIALAQHG